MWGKNYIGTFHIKLIEQTGGVFFTPLAKVVTAIYPTSIAIGSCLRVVLDTP